MKVEYAGFPYQLQHLPYGAVVSLFNSPTNYYLTLDKLHPNGKEWLVANLKTGETTYWPRDTLVIHFSEARVVIE